MKKLTLVFLILAIVVPVVADETQCVSESAPFYADWVTYGRPDCWCYARNCRGDVDGYSQGNPLFGLRWVYTDDLTTFLAAYGIKEPVRGLGILTVPNGICADFNRRAQGTISALRRVYTDDLNILLASYRVKEPPKGPGIGDCSGPDYNFFITPD